MHQAITQSAFHSWSTHSNSAAFSPDIGYFILWKDPNYGQPLHLDCCQQHDWVILCTKRVKWCTKHLFLWGCTQSLKQKGLVNKTSWWPYHDTPRRKVWLCWPCYIIHPPHHSHWDHCYGNERMTGYTINIDYSAASIWRWISSVVVLTEKVDSRAMASVLFIDFTVVRQSVTLQQTTPISTVLFQHPKTLANTDFLCDWMIFSHIYFFQFEKIHPPLTDSLFQLAPSACLLVSFHMTYTFPGSGLPPPDCQINMKTTLHIFIYLFI